MLTSHATSPNPSRWNRGKILSNTSFRADIEILRGVAVILVLLFHLKIAAFPSGFIGVDIFFVISGYLIAATLKGTSKADILDFYDRRIRRIIPLAFSAFTVVLLAAPFLFLPFETHQLTDKFIAATALAPNIAYWADVSYFEKQNFRPMLHFWSLGVEYHYYALFPVLLLLTRYIRFLPHLAFIISLALCVVLTDISAKTAFFLLPTRFWEFLLGYYAFTLQSKNILPLHARTTISLVCIAVLSIAASMPIPTSGFPGWYAVPVALAAAIFMFCGFQINSKNVTTFLKPIALTGRWSYSIYLIHFPVIFALAYEPFSYANDLTLAQKVFALILTYALSFLSYTFIETPFRNRQKITGKVFYRGLALYFVFAAGLVALYSSQSYFIKSHNPQIAKISYAMEDRGSYRCGKIKRITQYQYASCSLYKAENGESSALLIGNSHADAIKYTLQATAQDTNTSLYMMKQNCVLGEEDCALSVIESEIGKRNISAIILHATKDGYNPAHLQPLFDMAAQKDITIHIIAPTPEFKSGVAQQFYKEHKVNEIDQNFRQNKNDYHNEFSEYLNLIRMTHLPHVKFYPIHDILCPKECLLEEDGSLFYYDSHHLTLTGAQKLQPVAQRIFVSMNKKAH